MSGARSGSTRAQAVAALRSVGHSPIVRCFPHGAMIVFDHDLRYLVAGGLGLADVGLSQAMLEGRTVAEVFPADVVAQIEPLYRAALAGTESTMDVPFDGRIYLMRLAPLRDNDVIIAGMGFTQDVTEARRSEQALLESEERFRAAFEHAPIGKVLIGLDGRYEQVNQAMCDITGYRAEELQALTVADITHPDDLAADDAATGQLLAGAGTSCTIEKRYLTATGDVVWATKSQSVVRRDDGSPLHFIAQIQNISDRKQHEHVLAEERRRLREAQSIGHVGSWEFDVRANVINWSDTLFELYGLDPSSFAGDYEAALGCIHPDDRVKVDAATAACVRTGDLLRVRYRVTRASDGELRWFDARGEARSEDGQLVRLTGAVADVTEQVVGEAEVEKARDVALEASRQKSAFLATMSHELRTPMNAVIGMTGLLLDTPLDIRQREFVETVRNGGEVLLSIINDVLDFSKIEAGGLRLERQSFNLRDCVESSLDLVAATASAKGLELVGHVDSRCPTQALGDVTRVRQVLVNLLSNAVKFTDHGEVLVSVAPEDHAGEDLRLRISVTDTGIGIAADQIGSLFESFSQLDASTNRLYGGTGLGLAISRRLVEAMGGAIDVQSIAGAGTTFAFSVDLGFTDDLPTIPASASAGALAGKSVLVVDDNPTNRRIMHLQLTGFGMVVAEAESGDAAIAQLESEARFDVAVLDMKMPGMTGRELAARLRAAPGTRALPLILLSSYGDRWQREPRELFSAILTKPVRQAQLQESLKQALAPAGVTAPHVMSLPSVTLSPRVRLRVLVAEDNPVNQQVVRLMLEKLGQPVDAVGNGAEAAEAVSRVPYDLVFMDVQMPEMDGLQATRIIRNNPAIHHQPRIVALTADALPEHQEACTEAGMDDYLAKPLRLQDLDAALQRAGARA